jgi:hypothetical protein
MLDPQRLEFVTRHFRDLQRIRCAPVQILMILAPVWQWLPHVSTREAWGDASGGYLLVIPPVGESNRMMKHPVIITLYAVYAAFWIVARLVEHSRAIADIALTAVGLLALLITILDTTNVRDRRIAYGIGLVILFVVGSLILDVRNGAVTVSLAGSIWILLNLYDFLLLRRTVRGSPRLMGDVNIADLNRVIHEPARLAILTVLASCESADFTFLENAAGADEGEFVGATYAAG